MPALRVLSTGWARLSQAARQDPHKAGILAVLVVVMLVLWGRALLDNPPAPAGASVSPLATPSAADPAQPEQSGAGGATSRPAATAGADAWQQWLNAPILPLGRNPFAVNLDYFPPDPAKAAAAAAAVEANAASAHQLAKSVPSQADQEEQRRVLVENLRRQAEQIRLQSTMMGAQPKALIDGELVKEGDVVASFRVMKIEARRIILEREGIRLEVQMN